MELPAPSPRRRSARPASVRHDRRSEVEDQEVAGAVERLHLAADDPEEPHVRRRGDRCRSGGRSAVRSWKRRKWRKVYSGEAASHCPANPLAESSGRRFWSRKMTALIDDDGLGDRRDAAEQAGARGFAPDNTRGRRCPWRLRSGGTRFPFRCDGERAGPQGLPSPSPLLHHQTRRRACQRRGDRIACRATRHAGWHRRGPAGPEDRRGGGSGRCEATAPDDSIQLQGLDRFPLRLIDRPDHVERRDPQEFARPFVNPRKDHAPAPRDSQLPATDQECQEHRPEEVTRLRSKTICG